MKIIRNLSIVIGTTLLLEIAFRIPKYCWAGCPEAWQGYAKLAQVILVFFLAFKAYQNSESQTNKTL